MKQNLYRVYIKIGRILSLIISPIRWLLIGYTTRAYVVIEHDSRVLVVKNWLGKNEWSLPGGGIHAWERVESGVRRELEEEIGLSLSSSDIKFAKETFRKDSLGGKHYLLYHAVLRNEVPLKISKSEIVDHAWIPLTNIESLGKISIDIHQTLSATSVRQ